MISKKSETNQSIQEDSLEVLALKAEISRLRDGIAYASEETHCDDTWDYLNKLLSNEIEKSNFHRFNKTIKKDVSDNEK